MNHSDHVQRALREDFGHERLTTEQELAVASVLRGDDTLVVLPTGAGKSLCYQLPAVVLHQIGAGVTLVVSPLVALMQDQVDALRAKGIAADFINALVPRRQRRARIEAAKRGELAMLYIVPERFRQADFAASLPAMNVSLFVIDEAHCVSSWGHDFRPDYRRLGEYRARCRTKDGSTPSVLAATATATPAVSRDITEKLQLRRPLEVRRPVYRPNLHICALPCHGIDEKAEHVAGLLQRVGGAALVYTGLIARGEALREALSQHDVHLRFYNGDRPAAERRRLSRAFVEEPEPALLATNAFGMGIDRPDVRLIIHCEMPGSLEAWSQEIGRAGRDGAVSLCVALLDDDDLAIQQQHIRNACPDASLIQAVFDAVSEMGGNSAGWTEARLRERFAGRDRRDHRPITALRQLVAGGHIVGKLERGNLRTETLPAPHLLDQAAIDERRQLALHRLHATWRAWRSRSCAWAAISAWFGEDLPGKQCGTCSNELALDESLSLLPHRQQALRAAPPPVVADLPFQVGDWVRVGKRMGQVTRIGGTAEKRVLRVLMADSLREERILPGKDLGAVRKV